MSAGGGPERARAVIRAPNHLGELVLALPALTAAADRWPTTPVVQIVSELAPVLGIAGVDADPLPLEGRRRVVRAGLALRRRRPDVGILLTPSFSSALIFVLAGVRARRGTDTDGRGPLLTDPVDRAPLLRGHRVREYLRLVRAGEAASGAGRDGAARPGTAASPRGERDRDGRDGLPRPRLRRLGSARDAWRERARREGIEATADGPVVGLVPGGKAPARRWPADRFGELAERLAGGGCRVRVFGGADETEITARVAAGTRGVDDLGGRTDLLELAGGLAACDAVVGNDTGPLHLAAAADRPVVAVWGSGDPRQTRPLASSARLVGRFDLPCHPCLEAECPRRGAGYRSGRARRECLELIGVEDVEEAATAALSDRRSGRRASGAAVGVDTAPEGTGRSRTEGRDA